MITPRDGNDSFSPLHCYKMHGLGNDYIYVFDTELPLHTDCASLAIEVSDRHTGVGADGLVLISQTQDADFNMRIWNADGSEAQMCGNASRCVAVLVHILGLTTKDDITLSTLCGIKLLHVNRDESGNIDTVTVDMGVPELHPQRIPVSTSLNEVTGYVSFKTSTPVGLMEFTALSMGNPHGVAFINSTPDDKLLSECGPFMENHPLWPEKANIEFARVLDRGNIVMRVWERGSGETLACGTGACATAVAASLKGLADRKVKIHLPGGMLHIEWRREDSHVLMTGPAALIAELKYFPRGNRCNAISNLT